MTNLVDRFKCLIFLFSLLLSSQVSAQSEEVSTSYYYTTKGGENLIEILNTGLGVSKSFLKNEGSSIVNNIKKWNPHISKWDPIDEDKEIYLEFPKKYRFTLKANKREIKKIKPTLKRSLAAKNEVKEKDVKEKKKITPEKEEEKAPVIPDGKAGFMEIVVSAQTGSYEENTPQGSRIDSERGALGVGTHVVLKWRPEHKNYIYGDLIYGQSGSVTVGDSNTSFSTPNTWTFGAGIHMPDILFDWDFELGLERKEVSYLSYNKTGSKITNQNASSLLFGFKGTFYNVKARAVIPYILFDNESQLNFSYIKSLTGSGKLGTSSYSPSLSLSGYRFGIRQGIWKEFFLEAGYEYNLVNEKDTGTDSTETVLSFNIGSILDI